MLDDHPTGDNFHVLLQAGDPSAWEEFYLVYFDMMVWWAAEFGCSESEAYEVAQGKTTQLFARNRFTSFTPQGPYSFRRWLKRVVANEVCSQFRKSRRHTSTENLGEEELDKLTRDAGKDIADDEWSQADWACYGRALVKRALRAAIAQRPPQESRCFIRRVIRGEQAPDICVEMEIGRATFDSYVSRFRKYLSRELRRLLTDKHNCLGGVQEAFDEAQLLTFLRDIDIREKGDFDTVLETDMYPVSPEMEEVQSVLQALDRMPPPDPIKPNILAVGPSGRAWHTLQDGMKIGREEGNDIVLRGGGVSSLHASIHQHSRGWLIRDEKSTNHVFINHQFVNGEAFLIPGDWVQVSTSTLIYVGSSADWPE